MRTAAIILNWLIALLWTWRTTAARRNLPKLPDLLKENITIEQTPQPQITVIVPARNEEQAIEQTLRSLLAQKGISLEILAVDDRSTDTTGEIMDRIAAEEQPSGQKHQRHPHQGTPRRLARQNARHGPRRPPGDSPMAPLHRRRHPLSAKTASAAPSTTPSVKPITSSSFPPSSSKPQASA